MSSNSPLTELSLFSGYCGFTLGLRLAGLQIRTVGYVDHESYIQKLIAQRIQDGYLDSAPIFGDVRTFLSEGYAASYQGMVDILTAGFPCQPHSSAGQRLGKSDPHNLWPELAECIGVVRPQYILLENVPGLVDGAEPYVAVVLGDLARIGYDAQWGLVPAAALGAPHLRWRWWCLAYPIGTDVLEQQGRSGQQGCSRLEPEWAGATYAYRDGDNRLVADAAGFRLEEQELQQRLYAGEHKTSIPNGASEQVGLAGLAREHCGVGNANTPGQPNVQRFSGYAEPSRVGAVDSAGWWAVEPSLDRVVDGRPHRVDELRALGNGIVPAVVAEFLRRAGAAA